jgi:hypothetical protein
MTQKTSNFDDVAGLGKTVFGYVSTDTWEVEPCLAELGCFKSDKERFYRSRGGLKIEMQAVDLNTALMWNDVMGFMPMLMFKTELARAPRHYRKQYGELLELMNKLNNERYNVAFVNDTGSMAYVSLSEYY